MDQKPSPERLRNLFIDGMNNCSQFVFQHGKQPFMIRFSGKSYFVFIKHLTSAYFKDRPDTTRAQLAIRPEFESIKNSSIPFIFLGYDIQNDVYVCWNYHIVKNRLNEKKSVSFYSRESFQKEVENGEFLRRKLKNDDIPVLFKRNDLASFFEQVDSFFDKNPDQDVTSKSESDKSDGKLYKITEPDLIDKIHFLVNDKSYNILEAITTVQRYYENKYPNMKYSDWSNLIKITSQEPKSTKIKLHKTINIPFDAYTLDNLPLSTLIEESIRKFRRCHESFGPWDTVEFPDKEKYLLKIGAAKVSGVDGKVHPTVAGLLMFGTVNEIRKVFPNYSLVYRENFFPEQGEPIDVLKSMNIFEFFLATVNNLTIDIKVPFKLSGVQRVDETPLHDAVRETLVYCLANTNYNDKNGLVITKNFGSIIFEISGLQNFDKEKFIQGESSNFRNTTILKMFNLLKYSGCPKLKSAFLEQDIPLPEVNEDKTRTSIKLWTLKL